MMAATYVAIVETTGSFIAASRFGSATHIPPSVLSRGIGWQVKRIDCYCDSISSVLVCESDVCAMWELNKNRA
jgi:hypothetical protein